MPIPVATRKKMLAAVERGESVVSVARRFEVTQQGLHKRIKLCRERGTIEPRTPGPKGPTKLTPADDETMLSMIAENPGVTLREIATRMHVTVAESTLSRRLTTRGITLKKSP
ncbi:hypothetical protein MNBD_PLANCTO03-1751 [hydrothermal vent metagenome]|uniref:Transposase Synechocystis PCC 6803 domain-containing protein n=1 Tax=hydrothermal vent metagenome TaxID=652676 RepID=A0A3B1DLR6_9ZZZZ